MFEGPPGHLADSTPGRTPARRTSCPIRRLPAAVTTANPGEFLTPVQVIRTINGGLLPGPPKGEKGVLEAYLRAIHFAKRFIYLENQYFTNEAITQALIAALKANEELQLILVVPVEPDIPRYPHWQRGLIQRIAKSLGSTRRAASALSRSGATRPWTRRTRKRRGSARTTRTRSRRSSTTGPRSARRTSTARRSTSSSSSSTGGCRTSSSRRGELQHRHPRRLRAASPRGGSAVDALRRRLWAEHLGFVNPDGRRDERRRALGPAAARHWVIDAGRSGRGEAEGPRDRSQHRQRGPRAPWPLDPWRVNPSGT